MPEERWEWVAFTLGVVATGVLLALIVLHRSPKRAVLPTPVTVPATTAPRTATTVRTTTAAPASVPVTTTAPAPTPPQPVAIRLTARRDTWLSVRRAAGARTPLYQGTLRAGASRTFTGERFEIRFGAAANVQATLNGKPLSLPGGTYSVTVGRGGLGPRKA